MRQNMLIYTKIFADIIHAFASVYRPCQEDVTFIQDILRLYNDP